MDTQLEWIAAVVVFLASASAIFMMDSLGPGTKEEEEGEEEEEEEGGRGGGGGGGGGQKKEREGKQILTLCRSRGIDHHMFALHVRCSCLGGQTIISNGMQKKKKRKEIKEKMNK